MMVSCKVCPLCCRTIDPICRREKHTDWRAFYQPLRFKDGTNELGDPTWIDPRYDSASGRDIHSACWSLFAEKLIEFQNKRPTLDLEWLQHFRLCLRYLESLLNPIPFPRDNPMSLDVNLDQTDECYSKFLATQTGVLTQGKRFFPLPDDIVDLIYGFLEDYRDVLSFQKVTWIHPAAGVWLALGQKYLTFKDSIFAKGTGGEIASKIQQALWNVHHYPSKFPHAMNYAVLRQNVNVVVACMSDQALGLDTEINPTRLYDFPPHPVPSCIRRRTPYLETALEIVFRFRQVGSRSFLCGLTIGDVTTGYLGNTQKTINSQGLCGMRLMFDPNGIRSIQCKDNSTWSGCWHGLQPGSCDEDSVYTILEWDIKANACFVLTLDTFKVCDVSYIGSADLSHPKSIAWKSGIPSESVSPVFLFKNPGRMDIFPLSFVELDLCRFRVVSAHVKTLNQEITALEFHDGISAHCIGKPWQLTCKLSFFLKDNENLVLLAYGISNEKSLGLQVFTSHGRRAQFGPNNISIWKACCRPMGIFCSTASFLNSSLCVFGVLANDQLDLVKLPETSHSFKNLTKWERHLVAPSHKLIANTRFGFLVKADLAFVSGVTVYTKKDDVRGGSYICGMAVFSHDTPGMPQLLGEAQDEVRTFPIEGTLSSITTYYSQRYASMSRLSGLLFETSSQQRVQVGSLNGDVKERLQFNKHKKTLYWDFNEYKNRLTDDLSEFPLNDTIIPQSLLPLPPGTFPFVLEFIRKYVSLNGGY